MIPSGSRSPRGCLACAGVMPVPMRSSLQATTSRPQAGGGGASPTSPAPMNDTITRSLAPSSRNLTLWEDQGFQPIRFIHALRDSMSTPMLHQIAGLTRAGDAVPATRMGDLRDLGEDAVRGRAGAGDCAHMRGKGTESETPCAGCRTSPGVTCRKLLAGGVLGGHRRTHRRPEEVEGLLPRPIKRNHHAGHLAGRLTHAGSALSIDRAYLGSALAAAGLRRSEGAAGQGDEALRGTLERWVPGVDLAEAPRTSRISMPPAPGSPPGASKLLAPSSKSWPSSDGSISKAWPGSLSLPPSRPGGPARSRGGHTKGRPPPPGRVAELGAAGPC